MSYLGENIRICRECVSIAIIIHSQEILLYTKRNLYAQKYDTFTHFVDIRVEIRASSGVIKRHTPRNSFITDMYT